MDYNAAARADYSEGYRAYRRFDGTLFFKSPHNSEEVIEADNDVRVIEWDCLRAYQDAERKKGVPIGPEYFSHEKNYETIDCHFEFRRGGLSGDGRPYINVFALKNMYSVHCHAKFTNFRWRAGYPKKAQSNHCGGTSCPFEYSCVDGCMYPKGGQNG